MAMVSLLERIYEQEAEASANLQRADYQFEKQIDDLIKEYLSDYSDSFHEEIKNGIYASVFPMKKEIFLCGFRTAIGLILDCKMYE